MKPMPQNPLAQLKDIHLPPEPGWWPPAWGWWLLAILLLMLLAVILIKWYRYRLQTRPIRLALKELKEMDLNPDSPEQQRLILQQISGLVRRFSLIFFPRDQVADLCGQEWFDFICKHNDGLTETETRQAFSGLIQGPYAPDCNTDLGALREALEQWFKGLKKGRKLKTFSTKRKSKPLKGGRRS